jgi:hypothetical protein
MSPRKPTLLSYEPQAPASGLSGATILRLTAAIAWWAMVGVVGIVCVSAGMIAFLAWSTAPLPLHARRELAPLFAIACITAGGGSLVHFSYAMIRALLFRHRQ